MRGQIRKPSRYQCVICGKKVPSANRAYIREDRPFGARLCQEHAEIIGKHFSDVTITTLKLALIKKRLRQAGYEVDNVGTNPRVSPNKKILNEPQKLIQQIYAG